jgi:DNA-binding transcriptional MocR family regulator
VTHSWKEAFASRTRSGAADGIASILSLLALPDLISFAGGFPDPATFPTAALPELLDRILAEGAARATELGAPVLARAKAAVGLTQ